MSKMKMALGAGMVALCATCGSFGALNGGSGVLGGIFGGEAQAACAVAWEMGENSVSFCGGALEDGTFTAKLEGDDENGYVSTVILKDYKGPAFRAVGYGTGFPVKKYVVELEGLNEVALEDFEHVYMGGAEYELTGDGRLIVKTVSSDGSTEGGAEGSGDSSSNRVSMGSHEDWPDDALIGPTAEQATGGSSIVAYVAIAVGAAAVAALATFGVMKLVQRGKNDKKETEGSVDTSDPAEDGKGEKQV